MAEYLASNKGIYPLTLERGDAIQFRLVGGWYQLGPEYKSIKLEDMGEAQDAMMAGMLMLKRV